MADEAEDIGGISVSVGASHARLPGDLAEIDRLIESHFANGRTVQIRAELQGLPSQGGRAVGAPGASAPVTVTTAAAPAAAAPATAEMTALMTRMDKIASSLSASNVRALRQAEKEASSVSVVGGAGQRKGIELGDIKSPEMRAKIEKEIGAEPVDLPVHLEAQQATAQINEMRITAEKPIALNVDVEGIAAANAAAKELNTEFTAVLGTLREIAATMSTIARAPVAPVAEAGGRPSTTTARAAARRQPAAPRVVTTTAPTEEGEEGGGGGPKRKNIRYRDIGTEAEQNRVYSYGTASRAGFIDPGPAQAGAAYSSGEPGVYDEEDRRREARATRDRELAAASAARRREVEGARQDAAQIRAASGRPRPPTPTLNTPNQQAQYQTPIQASAATFVPGRDDQARPRAGAPFAQQPGPRGFVAGQPSSFGMPPPGVGTPPSGAPGFNQQGATGRVHAARQAQLRNDVLSDIAFTEQQENKAASQRSARVRRVGIDEEAAARQVEARRAAITGSGRTSRTLASGIGALFGGTEQRQIEAQVQAQQAARQLASAEKVIEPLDTRLRHLRERFGETTGAQQKFYGNQIKARESSKEYQDALAGVTKAVKENDAAQTNLAKISGAGSIARNLAAITVAGAGFGLALTAVGAAIHTIVPALGDAIDKAGGFGAVSNKVTQGFAEQTIAARGNVAAVLAQAEATAGLSASASDALDNQLKLTTQVKAGAIAAGQQGGLFRAALGANQQTPQGLLGGYGGIGGGPVLAQQLGGGAGFAETIKSIFGDFTNATKSVQNSAAPNTIVGGRYSFPNTAKLPPEEEQARVTQIATDRQAAETTLNDAAKRGAEALGVLGGASAQFATILPEQAKALQSSNLPQELKDLASQSNEALVDSSGNLVTAFKTATDALEQAAAGLSIPDIGTLGRIATAQETQRQREAQASIPAIQAQQAYERPSQVALVQRQTEYQIGTQLPAQLALSAMANPNLPVGTGIAPGDRKSVSGDLKGAQAEQDKLNALYKQGQQIIQDTYRPAIVANFGMAAAQSFDAALSAVAKTGRQIAQIQASISNEQAAYQVAQYNYQLVIARRTLSDIGGLTGKNFGAGQSYLGVLERQNLALSRQAQQLQFALSQRQINFQTALAGFQAPGITPEERQARVAEAKIEAGFAQKQLDIQRQMFGNQVQIVDIGNLRQGVDLAHQIGLLLQGRQVTIDTAAAQQKLIRLQQLQAENVKRVSAYLNAVDNLAGQAFSQIQRLEAAAGKAMSSVATTVLKQFGLVLRGLTTQLNQFAGSPVGQISYGGAPGAYRPPPDATGPHGASGLLGMTGGPTSIVAGEVNGEAVAILRNPKVLGGGLGGGTSVVVQFNGDIHTDSTADLAKITQAVVKALGRDASLKGLRGVG